MDQPNLLLISIDSLRADAVSSINGSVSTTPFFDKIAEESALFTSAFSQGIWTVPSHTSVFTGLYPTEHGIHDEDEVSAGEVSLGDHPTLGQRLKENGYETQSFYRLGWLSCADILRGFNTNSEDPDDEKLSIGDRLDLLSSKLPLGRTLLRATYRGTFRGHMADKPVVDQAIDAIQSASEPFCHFIHLNDAHWPYSPVKPFYNQFTDRSFPRLFWNRAYVQSRMFPLEDDSWNPSANQIDVMKDLYLGTVRQVDHHLKSLITAIPDDVLDETIIVIFGDHGEAFGEEGELGHNDIIPSVAHVPLLIRNPTGRLPTGRIDAPVQLADIYKTVGTLTGVSVPDTNANDLTRGTPSSPAFTHSGQNEESDSLLKKYGAWRSPSDYLIWDVVNDTLIRHGKTDGLKDILDEHLCDMNHVPPTGTKALDDEAKERLRELGYLN